MWLFYPSNNEVNTPTMNEESAQIGRPHEMSYYSAINTSTTTSTSNIDNDIIPQHDTNSTLDSIPLQLPNNNIKNNSAKKKHCGIVHFRPITSSDRRVIQTLHEEWFPVDYKDEFFDTLCESSSSNDGCCTDDDRDTNGTAANTNNSQSREGYMKQKQMNTSLYCCVACFKELSNDEYKKRLKKQKEGEEKNRSGWFSSWTGSGGDSSSREQVNDSTDEEYQDSFLWEFEEEEDDDDDRGTTNSSNRSSQRTYQATTTKSHQSPSNGSSNNDDLIESGESAQSIHHRREKERMEGFYSNGFHFDDDTETTCNGNNTQHQQTILKKKKGPYYNDNNERIIGCIIGSFLPSNLPSKKHRSTLNETIPRDETAQLLIPNCITHPRMFYIMTLGTTKEFRRCGLGSILVNKVVDVIQDQHNEELICGALYLHVILYNKGAIRLYERLGFMKVKLIKGEPIIVYISLTNNGVSMLRLSSLTSFILFVSYRLLYHQLGQL